MNRQGYNAPDALLYVFLGLVVGIVFGAIFGAYVGLLVWVGVLLSVNIMVQCYFSQSAIDILSVFYGPDGLPREFLAGTVTMLQNQIREVWEEMHGPIDRAGVPVRLWRWFRGKVEERYGQQ